MSRHLIEVPPVHETAPGAGRVMTWSTISFTLMFAVWLMFGILGVPIQEEYGLSDVQPSWIAAAAVVLCGFAVWVLVPRIDRAPGTALPLSEVVRPLCELRVWRFSLYYVVLTVTCAIWMHLTIVRMMRVRTLDIARDIDASELTSSTAEAAGFVAAKEQS